MRWISWLLLIGCAPAMPIAEQTNPHVEVIDGDTFLVGAAAGLERVRLIGIDAPERGECFSLEAADRLTELLGDGSSLRLEADVSDRDPFDRLLRYAWVGEVLVNEAVVGGGHARAVEYLPDVRFRHRLVEAESRARGEGLGLWGRCR